MELETLGKILFCVGVASFIGVVIFAIMTDLENL